MKTKAIRIYSICALISWVILAGWLNAFFSKHFDALSSTEKAQNYYFSIAYA